MPKPCSAQVPSNTMITENHIQSQSRESVDSAQQLAEVDLWQLVQPGNGEGCSAQQPVEFRFG